jgi:gliding motility-associated-like protein
MINVLVKGTISVETGFDDDFFGLVFGYREPTNIAHDNNYNFYLFDWKKKAELGANEGFRLSQYKGYIGSGEVKEFFWQDTQHSMQRKILKTKYGSGLGWESFKKYEVELYFSAGRIRIKIDDNTIFDLKGCFASGKFGFYCMSQQYSRFENFTYQSFMDFAITKNTACVNDVFAFNSFNLDCSSLPGFVESMHWDFGDGQTSTEVNPKHSYSQAGYFDVELIVYKTDGCHDTIIKSVEVKPLPIVDLGEDKEAVACSTLDFDAANSGSFYFWSTGETTQIIVADILNRDTTFWVTVEKDACKSSDTVSVFVEPVQNKLFFPSAFSPNGDGNNDLFAPIGKTEDVSFYQFTVFDRWGQIVFGTDSPFEGWNGKMSGKYSPTGVYTYKVNYRMGKLCSEIKDFSELSTITLIE